MRLAVQDNYFGKFTNVLMKHWQELGHTVLFEPGFNPNLIETCDRVFFETADTNIHLATQQRPHKKGKVILRIIDIDALVNGPAGVKPGYVDDIIYIAPHIQKFCQQFENLRTSQEHLVRMGVDTKRYNFREKPRGKKIAFIATRLTWEKGYDKALMIFTELYKQSKEWELHVVGRMFENTAWQLHNEHALLPIKDGVKFYGNLPYTENAINDFLEDKDYLLMCSFKEAFSFATAEAMSKGIKPVVYAFNGSEDIWPDWMLYKTETEALRMFEGEHEPMKYRTFIEQTYPLEKYLDEMDKIVLN